jgi:hypothetical protein
MNQRKRNQHGEQYTQGNGVQQHLAALFAARPEPLAQGGEFALFLGQTLALRCLTTRLLFSFQTRPFLGGALRLRFYLKPGLFFRSTASGGFGLVPGGFLGQQSGVRLGFTPCRLFTQSFSFCTSGFGFFSLPMQALFQFNTCLFLGTLTHFQFDLHHLFLGGFIALVTARGNALAQALSRRPG